MFYGVIKDNKICDSFYYNASQCRIQIEMAFGFMHMKWGIIWRPLRVKLNNLKYIVLAIAWLHNFTIYKQLLNNEQMEEAGTAGANRVYNPTMADDIVVDDNNQTEVARQKTLKRYIDYA
jgi:hypothetical protein